MGVAGWFVVVLALAVFGSAARDIIRSIRLIQDTNFRMKRLSRRKQDWTPREDPALWR